MRAKSSITPGTATGMARRIRIGAPCSSRSARTMRISRKAPARSPQAAERGWTRWSRWAHTGRPAAAISPNGAISSSLHGRATAARPIWASWRRRTDEPSIRLRATSAACAASSARCPATASSDTAAWKPSWCARASCRRRKSRMAPMRPGRRNRASFRWSGQRSAIRSQTTSICAAVRTKARSA